MVLQFYFLAVVLCLLLSPPAAAVADAAAPPPPEVDAKLQDKKYDTTDDDGYLVWSDEDDEDYDAGDGSYLDDDMEQYTAPVASSPAVAASTGVASPETASFKPPAAGATTSAFDVVLPRSGAPVAAVASSRLPPGEASAGSANVRPLQPTPTPTPTRPISARPLISTIIAMPSVRSATRPTVIPDEGTSKETSEEDVAIETEAPEDILQVVAPGTPEQVPQEEPLEEKPEEQGEAPAFDGDVEQTPEDTPEETPAETPEETEGVTHEEGAKPEDEGTKVSIQDATKEALQHILQQDGQRLAVLQFKVAGGGSLKVNFYSAWSLSVQVRGVIDPEMLIGLLVSAVAAACDAAAIADDGIFAHDVVLARGRVKVSLECVVNPPSEHTETEDTPEDPDLVDPQTPEGEPELKPETKPEETPEVKPEEKPEDKPEEESPEDGFLPEGEDKEDTETTKPEVKPEETPETETPEETPVEQPVVKPEESYPLEEKPEAPQGTPMNMSLLAEFRRRAVAYYMKLTGETRDAAAALVDFVTNLVNPEQ